LNHKLHQALDDFCWILNNIAEQTTRIAKLVPMLPSDLGYYDNASGTGSGGVWFLTQHLVPRGFYCCHPCYVDISGQKKFYFGLRTCWGILTWM
jgi:hypothetical protein